MAIDMIGYGNMWRVNFEQFTGVNHPQTIYEKIYYSLLVKKFAYVSGPITSGDYREQHPELEMSDIINANHGFAQVILDLLAQTEWGAQVTVALPHDLGPLKMPSQNSEAPIRWKEHDYLIFWAGLLGRIQPILMEAFREFMLSSPIQYDVMSDHSKSRSERIPQYQAFEDAAVLFLRKHVKKLNRVPAVWRLPGAGGSLGSVLEQHVAERLSIPRYDIAPNPTHPKFSEQPAAQNEVVKFLQSLKLLRCSNDPGVLAGLVPCLEKMQYLIV